MITEAESDALEKADGLSPPEEVADLHDDFVETLRTYADAVEDRFEEFQDELDNVDSFDELESLFAGVQRSIFAAFALLEQDFEPECARQAPSKASLEQAAADHGIIFDFECD